MAATTVIQSNGTAIPTEQKYFLEAMKRKREEHTKQFEQLHFCEDPRLRSLADDVWADHATLDALPMPIDEGGRTKFFIMGAGMGGLTMAIKLIKKGFSAAQMILVDTAGGIGGTWYWNRYPGLHCDVESYSYFPLLEDTGYMPKQKYSSSVEIRKYLEELACKYGLSDRVLFRTQATSMRWDDDLKTWKVDLIMRRGPQGMEQRRFSVHTEFVTIASGLYPYPQVPKVPGLRDFEGPMLHPARWDYRVTGGSCEEAFPEMEKLRGKRVGVVGTGSTAVQVVPQVAKYAREVYVFQRTPSQVFARGQRDTDPAEWHEKIAAKPGWHRARMDNLADALSGDLEPGEDVVEDELSKINIYAPLFGSSRFGTMTPEKAQEYIRTLMELDLKHTEKARARIANIVKNKETAQKLTPWYPSWCKRATFSDMYLEAFNNNNVHLIDTNGKGVEKFTQTSVVANGQGYPVDILVLGTGYRRTFVGGDPGSSIGIEILGRNGRRMADKWQEQGVSTFHGVITNGFPNLFFQSPIQGSATANYTHVIEVSSEHSASIIAMAYQRLPDKEKSVVIEPSTAAEEAWGMKISEGAAISAALAVCNPTSLDMEVEALKLPDPNDPVAMKKAKAGIWSKGIVDFTREMEKWRSNGNLDGLDVILGS